MKVASYTLDLGIKLDDFLANGSTAGYNFSVNVGAAYAAYAAADGNLAFENKYEGTRWAIYAADNDSFGDPLTINYLTSNTGGNPARPQNVDLQTVTGAFSLVLDNVNLVGSHGQNPANNGDSFIAKGAAGVYVESDLFGSQNIWSGAAIGATSQLYHLTNSSYDSTELAQLTSFAGTATFNGSTFSYAVPAIPEPGTVSLFMAGLGVMGFIARRRRNG